MSTTNFSPLSEIDVQDHSKRDDMLESLPANARKYYFGRSSKEITDIFHKISATERFSNYLNLLRLYPILHLKYLNSNELICTIVNGDHRISSGPGFFWVVGITDRIVSKHTVGDDISFGPIKLIFVKPGTLKYASLRNTGRPMLLGPGMHYFNDIMIMIGPEISLRFKGNNAVVSCDPSGTFQFVFVKTGSEGIVIDRNGALSTLSPGLHFIEAPDSLSSFVSIQQEHFRFGTCDSGQCFLTADNIELHINATIFYRITDVKTMFSTRIKDNKDPLDTLHSQAMATLLTIIRSENFQGIGGRNQIPSIHEDVRSNFIQNVNDLLTPVAEVLEIDPSVHSSAPPVKETEEAQTRLMMGFQNIIHDAEPQFQRMMQTNFSNSGIDIQSLRIEQIEFADKDMQKQVSEFAMTNTKLTSQQQTISAQKTLRVAEAERDAATMLISSQAEADKKTLLANAENKVKTNAAQTAAENIKILAVAEASNITTLAEANAKAKLCVGEAELLLMERQNKMSNADLRIFTEAQKEVLKGVSKIVYTDQQSLLLKPFLNYPDLHITSSKHKDV